MIQAYIAIFVLIICLYFKFKLSFWARKKVEGPAPVPIFGNIIDFVVTKKKHAGEIYRDIYDSYPTACYVGIYKMNTPALLVRDLELIKSILVTDFNVFNKNDFEINEKADPLIAVNPFCVPGDDWKAKRTQLSPLFTQSRNRIAIPFINDVSKRLLEYIEGGPESATMEFDVKDLSAKYTTDNVAAVAFGLDGESFTNPNANFRKMGDEMFKPTLWMGVKQQIILFMPFLNKFLQVPFVPKHVDRKFREIVNQVVDGRDKNKTRRDDLLQVILDLREKHGKEEYNENTVVGHSMTFLTEGYETSSTTMSMTLYEFALNPEIQRRAQAEIDGLLAESNGEITEDVINKLQYLESCIQETVRLHCPVFMLSKMNLKEYELPPQFEGSNRNVTIPEDTIVIVPVYAIHLDKTYFPDPYKFDPDRFNKENKDSIPKYAYLAFGEGPRICLGMKFGITQVKGGIAAILSKYNVTRYEKTEVPFKFSKGTFNLQPENGIWLKLVKRTKVPNEE